jgi:hypothetical protein
VVSRFGIFFVTVSMPPEKGVDSIGVDESRLGTILEKK